jgi:hypothetical protein
MTIGVRPRGAARQEPETVVSSGAAGPASQFGAVSHQRDVVWLGIGLAALTRLLRDPRFHGRVIVSVVGLAALASLARENQARVKARLVAWDRARRLLSRS